LKIYAEQSGIQINGNCRIPKRKSVRNSQLSQIRRNAKAGLSVYELCKIACEENKQVKMAIVSSEK
jgi:hypothetical protein